MCFLNVDCIEARCCTKGRRSAIPFLSLMILFTFFWLVDLALAVRFWAFHALYPIAIVREKGCRCWRWLALNQLQATRSSQDIERFRCLKVHSERPLQLGVSVLYSNVIAQASGVRNSRVFYTCWLQQTHKLGGALCDFLHMVVVKL